MSELPPPEDVLNIPHEFSLFETPLNIDEDALLGIDDYYIPSNVSPEDEKEISALAQEIRDDNMASGEKPKNKRPLEPSQNTSVTKAKAMKTGPTTYSLVASNPIEKHEIIWKNYPVIPYFGDFEKDSDTKMHLKNIFGFIWNKEVRNFKTSAQKNTEKLNDRQHILAVFPQNQTYFVIGDMKLVGNLFAGNPDNKSLHFNPTLGALFAKISDDINECNAVASLHNTILDPEPHPQTNTDDKTPEPHPQTKKKDDKTWLDFHAIRKIEGGEKIVVFSQIVHVDGFVTNHIDQADQTKIYHAILKSFLQNSVAKTRYAKNNFFNYKENTMAEKEKYRAIVLDTVRKDSQVGWHNTNVHIFTDTTSKVGTAEFITTAIGYLFI